MRKQPAAEIYVKLLMAIDARRRRRRVTCMELDARAGTQDGYYAKALHPNTKSGRQAGYYMVDLLAEALFPGGYDVVLVPRVTGGQKPKKDPQQLDLFERAA